MNRIKGFLLTAGVVIGALVLVGFLLPAKFHVERSREIPASPAQIHAVVGDLETWGDWTTWAEGDPSMVVTPGARTTGVGASQSWTSKSGPGELVFTKSSPEEGLAYDIALGHSRSVGAIRYEPKGEVTNVVWTMDGDAGMNIMDRYFGLLMDGMVGKDFEKSLEKLEPAALARKQKDLEAEAAAQAAAAVEDGAEPDLSRLLDPSALTAKAPDRFSAEFRTTKGDFVIEVQREWAPNGADRFYNLVRNGFYDNVRFFRVVPGFMVQFGINGDPAVSAAWFSARIPDDPVRQSNTRGFVSFATSGPDSRTTQVFVNFADRNAGLDAQGFSPFGRVVAGMDVVDQLYNGYGESAPAGRGPVQARIQQEGNAYLQKEFEKLDYVKSARIQPR